MEELARVVGWKSPDTNPPPPGASPHASEPARRAAATRPRARGHVDADGFFNLLTGPELLERVEWLLPEHRERVFPPTETLAMFLAQALSPDGSCRQAVDDAAVKRLIAGLAPHSTSTSAYCQARARLPLPMISTLAREAGESWRKGPQGGGTGEAVGCVWSMAPR